MVEHLNKGNQMSDEIKQMVLRYLADMTDRGDYEAKKLFDMISQEHEDDE